MSQLLNHIGCVHPGGKNQCTDTIWKCLCLYSCSNCSLHCHSAERTFVSTLSLSLLELLNATCTHIHIEQPIEKHLGKKTTYSHTVSMKGLNFTPSQTPAVGLPPQPDSHSKASQEENALRKCTCVHQMGSPCVHFLSTATAVLGGFFI